MKETNREHGEKAQGNLFLWLGLIGLLLLLLCLAIPPVRHYRALDWVEVQGGSVETEPSWLRSRLPSGFSDWLSDKGVLRTFEQVSEVDLYGTQVSDAGLAHLSGMTSMQFLGLGGTQVSDARKRSSACLEHDHQRGMKIVCGLKVRATNTD